MSYVGLGTYQQCAGSHWRQLSKRDSWKSKGLSMTITNSHGRINGTSRFSNSIPVILGSRLEGKDNPLWTSWRSLIATVECSTPNYRHCPLSDPECLVGSSAFQSNVGPQCSTCCLLDPWKKTLFHGLEGNLEDSKQCCSDPSQTSLERFLFSFSSNKALTICGPCVLT